MYLNKTGKLFEFSFCAPFILANRTQLQIEFAKEYGLLFGLIFQIIDDIIDEVGTLENIGKKVSCDNCHCEAIANSNHIDVLEMDAASRTGVDDVRQLIEFSRYGPTSARYKIFIIDEVHMLSKQAFNGLLKTLEEPPERLKFILATTEVRKIPVTILSRWFGAKSLIRRSHK